MAQYTFSGLRGYQFRITLTENVGTPSQNYSTISWTIEHIQTQTKYDTVGNRVRYLTINGTNVYYQNAPYSTVPYGYNVWWQVATGTSGTIAHNNDGTGSFQWSFYWDGYAFDGTTQYGPNNTLGQGVSSGTQTFTMTTIPRYANFTGRTTTTTDVAISNVISVDATCDYIALSIDNGSTYPYAQSGDFTTTTISTTGQLRSGTSYNCAVQVRRKDSGLYSYLSPYTVTTASQNNFMGLL